jgi:iron complex transport system substrate-binding protein
LGLLLLLAVAGLAALAWLGSPPGNGSAGSGKAREAGGNHPERIISMAPSTTETLFALGLGDRVVGVTRYCDYPAATAGVSKVGGYVDPSYEAIVSVRPDLVILLSSHREAKVELVKLGIGTLTVPHKTIADIDEAIRLIGKSCGAEDKADALLRELTGRSEAVRRAVEEKNRPSVLLCIGRDTDSGQLAAMYVAGREGFYDEIITMAGGANAYRDEQVPYPQLSAEGVIRLNPDVIVDLVSHINPGDKTPEEVKQQWSSLRTVTAVREGRVFVIVGHHALRPGPRYVEFAEQLVRLLHPESFAEGASDE